MAGRTAGSAGGRAGPAAGGAAAQLRNPPEGQLHRCHSPVAIVTCIGERSGGVVEQKRGYG